MNYKRTSIIVDARVWDGTNEVELNLWAAPDEFYVKPVEGVLYMDTIEGEMSAKVGDYVFKTPQGWHSCNPMMFLANHDLV